MSIKKVQKRSNSRLHLLIRDKILSCRRSQVWIETVIYTLMALTIIGIVLGIVKPAIDEYRDAVSISQSKNVLNGVDGIINEIKYTPGNSRNLELKITRGKMIVDGEEDKIRIIIDNSKYAPSGPGLNVTEANVIILTNSTKNKKIYLVTLTLDYKNKFDISYQGANKTRVFQYAPTPYKVSVKNNGGGIFNIDFF